MRYKANIVTDEMLAYPKLPFIIIGLLEALGVVSGMYSGGMKDDSLTLQEWKVSIIYH